MMLRWLCEDRRPGDFCFSTRSVEVVAAQRLAHNTAGHTERSRRLTHSHRSDVSGSHSKLQTQRCSTWGMCLSLDSCSTLPRSSQRAAEQFQQREGWDKWAWPSSVTSHVGQCQLQRSRSSRPPHRTCPLHLPRQVFLPVFSLAPSCSFGGLPSAFSFCLHIVHVTPCAELFQ